MVGINLRNHAFIDSHKKQDGYMVKSCSLNISNHNHVKGRRYDAYLYLVKSCIKYIRKLPYLKLLIA